VSNNVVSKFEREFADYLGIKHAIATSYGRTALYLGLDAIGVKNKEVIIPAFICTVVRHAVVLAGAIPKFADISYHSLDYDLEDLKNKITHRTKAIVVTHYFGKVAHNLEEIISLGKEKGITIIEDCAHSLGAQLNGKKVGTFGDFSIFSLTKNTINYGGGVLATNNDQLDLKARDILKMERFTLKNRIVDFPIILSYGLEQMVDKLVFDRVGKSIFKWWLIKLPQFIITTRNYLITAFKAIFSTKTSVCKPSLRKSVQDDLYKVEKYPFPLSMSQIIASIGRNQLRKIDHLIDKRKTLFNTIVNKVNFSFNRADKEKSENANTFIVLTFNKHNIFEIISRCRKNGLLLRATWPTHQKLWEEQDTQNVNRIKREFLTWTVNPMLKTKEIDKFVHIINNSCCN